MIKRVNKKQNTIVFKLAPVKPTLSFTEVVNIDDITTFDAIDYRSGKKLGRYTKNDIIRKFG